MVELKRQKTSTTAQASSVLKLRASIDAELEQNLQSKPLRYKGSFESFDKFNISPYIGTEFRKGAISLRDLLEAENSDELLKDRFVLIAERGVILFRDQDITPDEHSLLVRKLSTLPLGKDANDALLHIHPMTHSNAEYGDHLSRFTPS
jgi:hypothetical protein